MPTSSPATHPHRPTLGLGIGFRRRALLLAGWTAPLAAFAQRAATAAESAAFDRRARVAGSELVLNGTGVRAVAWFTGYSAGLYLPTRAASPAQVLALDGPKRIQLRMLHDVPAAEFVKAFRKGMLRNTAPAEQPRLSLRIERFAGVIAGVGTVKKGDVVDLDFDPGRGTSFLLNGTLRGDAIEGSDFYAALLRSFVGERPYDDKLKAGLLGQATG
jgi:hypothetical protein